MQPSNSLIAEQYAKLSEWLAKMDPAIAEFIQSFPPEERDKLDYSLDSLDYLETCILSGFRSIQSHRATDAALDENSLLTAASYYAFAVYQRHLPESRFDVAITDTRFPGFGCPNFSGQTIIPFGSPLPSTACDPGRREPC